jgi:hypothetical protein
MMHGSKRIKIDENQHIITLLFDDTKDLTNKKPYIYEKFIINEHDEKIKFFNMFIESLVGIDFKINKLKTFANSLGDNELHLIIKYIISKHYQIQRNNNISKLVFSDILTNDLTDFTIHFPDGNFIKCLKILLKSIHYFSMIFDDFNECTDSITLDVDYKIASIVIGLLYEQSELVTVENCYEVIKLMDMWLMESYYIDQLSSFMENHIEQIIKFLFEHERFDDILILENILDKHDKMVRVVNGIFRYDFKDKIFMFNNWQAKFTNDTKIQAIISTGNFELLNVANIDPYKVIKLLLKYNDVDILETIYMMKKCSASRIYFKTLNVHDYVSTSIDSIAIIDNYYPTLKVTIFSKTDMFREINGPVYTIDKNLFSTTHPLKEITIGSHILIGNDIKLIHNNPDHEYYINNFSKRVDGTLQNRKKLSFHSFKNSVIQFDRNPDKIGAIWTKKIFECELNNKIDILNI